MNRLRGYGGAPALDRGVPLLIVKIGRYPLHHGTTAAVRTVGRLGVPVYAVTEDRIAPVVLSRYLTDHFLWPTTGRERASELLAGLRSVGQRIGRRCVALATDDEAALLLAEHRDELADLFLLPAVAPELPGRLADKARLYELCREHGVPTPMTVVPEDPHALADAVGQVGLPAVVKNVPPWDRLIRPAVGSTTLLRTPEDVAALRRELDYAAPGSYLVQEYIPGDHGPDGNPADWFAHCHRGGGSSDGADQGGDDPGGGDSQGADRTGADRTGADRDVLVFTGVKIRSWPPGRGVTSRGVPIVEPNLARRVAELCAAIDYRGVGDMDWRLDARDGQFKLVDFNPRVGAQFQMFRTSSGVDVVRALHLSLTGRPIPPGTQLDQRVFVVEHLDAGAALSAWAHRRRSAAAGSVGATDGVGSAVVAGAVLPAGVSEASVTRALQGVEDEPSGLSRTEPEQAEPEEAEPKQVEAERADTGPAGHRGAPDEGRRLEPAWFAWDDPLPFAMATARFGYLALRGVARRTRRN